MVNARRLDNDTVYRLAFERLCELSAEAETEPLERDFAGVLAAHEELLTQKNGRKSRATRTRAKLKAKGLRQCLADWSASPETADGFKLLSRQGLGELTGDYLVVKYAGEFDGKTVTAAKRHLKAADIPFPEARDAAPEPAASP